VYNCKIGVFIFALTEKAHSGKSDILH